MDMRAARVKQRVEAFDQPKDLHFQLARPHHSPMNGGVQCWRITPGGQNPDAFHAIPAATEVIGMKQRQPFARWPEPINIASRETATGELSCWRRRGTGAERRERPDIRLFKW